MSATLEIPDNLCELNLGVMWWVMRDSNSRHLRCKRSALPTELITLNSRLLTML